tara:strand:+ start:15018 stop:15467 length:450 start_codon:yes stop_codon:yes gene_type:complete
MHGDAKYKNLQTTNFIAKHIIAEEITLQDTIIKSDPMMAGATLKRLYESQRNTNVFDDTSKKTLESLNATVFRNTQNVQMFKLPLLSDFDTNSLPNNHAVMCFDSHGKVVYICKFDDIIRHFTLPVYEPYVNVVIDINEDNPLIKLNVI